MDLGQGEVGKVIVGGVQHLRVVGEGGVECRLYARVHAGSFVVVGGALRHV